ncbi:MAG: Stp1/IreP family PP2C-type Ser/Thr phosphatase [Dehalococcoidia bacterium]|nr:Stp1/IreP family PP2C-type Ser/Thr phosphatase [Dehalococcoidia bacterium]
MRFLRVGGPEPPVMSAEGITDVGVLRSNNEDNFSVRLDEEAPLGDALLAVADGMGGHAAGEIASQISLDLLIEALSKSTSLEERTLQAAVEQANDGVYRASSLGPNMQGMGTTLVAGLLVRSVLHICNVGDSRAYLLREGRLAQLTRDHSWVGDMVARGLLTPEQAAVHPRRSVLTRALGVADFVQVDVTRVSLRQGDRILLCSDGLYGLVDEDTIATVLNRGSLRSAARELVRLANNAGGTDNVTVVVAQMNAAVEIVESETDGPMDTLTPGSPAPSQVQGGMRIAGFALGDAGSGVGPPWRRRLSLFAGGFGAIIVIVLVLIVVTQTGEDDEGADRLSLAIPSGNGTTTPTHTPTPVGEGVSSAATLGEAVPTGTPDAPPTVSPTQTPSPTAMPTPRVTPEPTITPTQTPKPPISTTAEKAQEETPLPKESTQPSVSPASPSVPAPVAETSDTPIPTITPTPTATSTVDSAPSPVSTTTLTITPTPTHTTLPIPTHTPSPTPTPTHTHTPSATPTYPPSPTATFTLVPEPLLVVEYTNVSPTDPEVWEEVRITVVVINQGQTTSSEFFVSLVDHHGTGKDFIERKTVDGLEAGQKEEVTFVWRAEVEKRTFGLVLASHYAEDQVIRLPSINVAVPDYAIEQVTWRPKSPAINEDVTFLAHVKNTGTLNSEYDTEVVFYLGGEYHSVMMLDRGLNAGATRDVESQKWKAQSGAQETLAVIYPLASRDQRDKSSWDEYDKRYAIAEHRATYDATRLPNLAVTEIVFSERRVTNTDTLYLDLSFNITNEIGDGGTTPPVDNEFDVRIEFVDGPFCPLRPGRTPCAVEIQVDELSGGLEESKKVEGQFQMPLPPSGDTYTFSATVTVDPEDGVEESSETDNTETKDHRVSG